MKEVHPRSTGTHVLSVQIWDICLWLIASPNTCMTCTITCGCVLCVDVSNRTKVNSTSTCNVCTGNQVSLTSVIILGAANPSPPCNILLTISLFMDVSIHVASVVTVTEKGWIGLIMRDVVMVLSTGRYSRHCMRARRQNAVKTVVESSCRPSTLLT